mmetsp:Transcript_957/g.1702  ORF Transcript_957/g.1702 Transcript_957/m.1702 type:complete len:97 (-) Transcript_957:383-673(-)|eukprot:CAMPEP_0168610000 /NCGR_PEP_ID=MMETSP0449_2-20121227/1528_1 /TAXON_ID=1082188 /ORGANISM="Strombidium rassoulzadegani, Strain ras09" /LENGTH=96 /DNA_ID=CAMNT_0008650225 /DNA_START=594 /DNA_END=884 /DNA_ORIENTATION=-
MADSEAAKGSALAYFMDYHKDNQFSWEVIRLIKSVVGEHFPVAAKGIMCEEDARLAIEHGADIVYVSNHGARQLDTTPTTVEVLPEVVGAVREMEG